MKAFPGEKGIRFGQQNDCNEGMDLRDYFAAKAMHAYLNAIVISFMDDKCKKEGAEPEILSKVAYQLADAMMKAREA